MLLERNVSKCYTIFPQIIALWKGDGISTLQTCMTADETHEHTGKK